MKLKKVLIYSSITLILVIFAIYYKINHDILSYYAEKPQKSLSIEQSKHLGVYLGEYKPLKRRVLLQDNSSIYIPNAWIERSWQTELDFFLKATATPIEGFNFTLPLLTDPPKTTANDPPLSFDYGLDLTPESLYSTLDKSTSLPLIEQYPALRHIPGLGFQLYLHKLPDVLVFRLIQKESSKKRWEEATVIDEIEMVRNF